MRTLVIAAVMLASALPAYAGCADIKNPDLAALCRAKEQGKVHCNRISDPDLRKLCKIDRK